MQSYRKAVQFTDQNVHLFPYNPQKLKAHLGNVIFRKNVAVLFLGRAELQAAITTRVRMAGPSNVNLTMMRLLDNGTVTGYNVKERLDNDMVNEFRVMIIGNNGAMYIEEVAVEGSGTASTILSMESNYQLMAVERCPESLSPLVSWLTEWNEHRELWTVGDLLASADFSDDTTILGVLQHYISVERMMTIELPLKSFYRLYIPANEEANEKSFYRKILQSLSKFEYSS